MKETDTTARTSGAKRRVASHPVSSDKRRRWTELSAVGHILADEIQDFQENHGHELSEGELRQLRAWSDRVQSRMYDQSAEVLENVELTQQARQSQKEVERTQDDVLILRTQIKTFQTEARQLGDDAVEHEKQESALKKASQFVKALQSMAEGATRKIVTSPNV
jgi:glucan-binding YG repeat protein